MMVARWEGENVASFGPSNAPHLQRKVQHPTKKGLERPGIRWFSRLVGFVAASNLSANSNPIELHFRPIGLRCQPPVVTGVSLDRPPRGHTSFDGVRTPGLRTLSVANLQRKVQRLGGVATW